MSFPYSLDIIVYSGTWQANYPTLKMINANRKNDDSLIIFFFMLKETFKVFIYQVYKNYFIDGQVNAFWR